MSRKNLNRQGFYNRLDDIKNTERDKDAFLKASRLERHESHRKPLSGASVATIGLFIAVAAIGCTALILGYLSGNFTTALGAVAILAFFGFIFGFALSAID